MVFVEVKRGSYLFVFVEVKRGSYLFVFVEVKRGSYLLDCLCRGQERKLFVWSL